MALNDFTDVLAANEQFAADFTDPGRPGRAGTGLAVLTCMDSRIDPLRALGLQLGDAKIIRNAGAQVTDEVLRTLSLASALLGVERVLVMPHTDCGMTKRTDEQVQQEVRARTGADAGELVFGTVRDQRATLERDVERLRSWPFLPAGTAVAGAVYDVSTGRLDVVAP